MGVASNSKLNKTNVVPVMEKPINILKSTNIISDSLNTYKSGVMPIPNVAITTASPLPCLSEN